MTLMFPAPKVPEDNPVPWLTDLWKRSGCFGVDSAIALQLLTDKVAQQGAAAVEGSAAFAPEVLTLSAILDTVKSTVTGLHDTADVYNVVFEKINTAGTDFHGKSVVVGVKPLMDTGLTEGQRAAIIVGAILHEDGHINDTQPFRAAVQRKWPQTHPDFALAHEVSNIGEDNRIEHKQLDRYNGLRDALATAMWYFAKNQAEGLLAQGFTMPVTVDLATPRGRKNALLLAVRYPWQGDWSNAQEALDFLLPWRDSMVNCVTPKEHVRLTGEAVDWIRSAPQPNEQPEQPTEGGEEGEEATEGGEKGRPDSTESGEGEGNPTEGDGQGEDTDDATESGEDSGDNDGDGESTEGGDTKSGESKAEGDPEGHGEGNPTDGGDSTEGEADDTDGDGSEEPVERTESRDNAAQGGGNSSPELSSACPLDDLNVAAEQSAAGLAVGEHQRSRQVLARTRRYNGTLVRERTIVRFAAMGEEVSERDQEAVRSVDMAIIPRHRSKSEVKRLTDDNNSAPSVQRSAALAAVISSSRKGQGAPERLCRSGRVDRSRLHRVSQGDTRVFIRRTAAAPQRVRAYVLLDASSSMAGRAFEAIRAGTDLAGALEAIPWAQGKVYAHTEDMVGPFVVPLWKSGEDTAKVADYLNIPMTGTPEGFALAFVCDDLLEDLRPSEKGVVIVCADGGPNDMAQVKSVVDYYRRKGLRIVSISIAAALRETTQRMMYGTDVVPYDANASVFARNLGKVIGSSL